MSQLAIRFIHAIVSAPLIALVWLIELCCRLKYGPDWQPDYSGELG